MTESSLKEAKGDDKPHHKHIPLGNDRQWLASCCVVLYQQLPMDSPPTICRNSILANVGRLHVCNPRRSANMVQAGNRPPEKCRTDKHHKWRNRILSNSMELVVGEIARHNGRSTSCGTPKRDGPTTPERYPRPASCWRLTDCIRKRGVWVGIDYTEISFCAVFVRQCRTNTAQIILSKTTDYSTLYFVVLS